MTEETNNGQQEQIQLEQQADPRIRAIAAEARGRGWDVLWSETQHRTELLVLPVISDPKHQNLFVFTVAASLGGRLICWISEGYSETLIEPWYEKEEDDPGINDESAYPEIVTLNDACKVFDRAVARFLAWQRRYCLENPWPGCTLDPLESWADIEPLARAGGEA